MPLRRPRAGRPAPARTSGASLASLAATVQDAQASLASVVDTISGLTGGSDNGQERIDASSIRTIPRWHFAMLNDADRNEAFETALRELVPPGSHVLDIGSGTGLLAMMAADASAARVTTCEVNPLLAELATEIIDQHGMAEVVNLVPKFSTDLVVGQDLPRRVDVVISEIVDGGLIGEGMLPTLRHARSHLLAPGGFLVPQSAKVVGALVQSEVIDRLNRVGRAARFDVRSLNRVATKGHFPVRLGTWPHRLLSQTTDLVSFDFAVDPLVDGSTELALPAVVSGEAHGLVIWFEMGLGGGAVLRNTPQDTASHWMQAFVPFDEPVAVEAGEDVSAVLTWESNRFFLYHPHTGERR